MRKQTWPEGWEKTLPRAELGSPSSRMRTRSHRSVGLEEDTASHVQPENRSSNRPRTRASASARDHVSPTADFESDSDNLNDDASDDTDEDQGAAQSRARRSARSGPSGSTDITSISTRTRTRTCTVGRSPNDHGTHASYRDGTVNAGSAGNTRSDSSRVKHANKRPRGSNSNSDIGKIRTIGTRPNPDPDPNAQTSSECLICWEEIEGILSLSRSEGKGGLDGGLVLWVCERASCGALYCLPCATTYLRALGQSRKPLVCCACTRSWDLRSFRAQATAYYGAHSDMTGLGEDVDVDVDVDVDEGLAHVGSGGERAGRAAGVTGTQDGHSFAMESTRSAHGHGQSSGPMWGPAHAPAPAQDQRGGAGQKRKKRN